MYHSCKPFHAFIRTAKILLLFLMVFTLWFGSVPAVQTAAVQFDQQAFATTSDLSGPAGSVAFGGQIYALPNGNLIVVDSRYSEESITEVGAVYLYDGATHRLINKLTGSNASDMVGYMGVKVLASGNYLVLSPNWNRGDLEDAGAVTWCDGSTGCSGVVSASNSLVGSSSNEKLGNTVTVLKNGNYVIRNPNWKNGTAASAGAVTWCSGAVGCTGEASPENSLVGAQFNDRVGYWLTQLSDSDYVVQSYFWQNESKTLSGAATLCSGTTGCFGRVSESNSLVGGSFSITELKDGNFVAIDSNWNNGGVTNAGAVRWCDGNTGCIGTISPTNSLVGAQANDRVGKKGTFVLNDGNYVVSSPEWSNGSITSVGAATWCPGTSGCSGTVPDNQSLIGTQHLDLIGEGGVQGLTNGNYVVMSPNWREDSTFWSGAATFCYGDTGCKGTVSPGNSLIDINRKSTALSVGMNVIPLDNGNYVVSSPNWNGSAVEAGAVTWCDGLAGCIGRVSASNSLIGSHTMDHVGRRVDSLPGGKYVISSFSWDNGTVDGAGAVTFCNGTTDCIGIITPHNSMVGEHSFDSVGDEIIVLSHGNYVVSSAGWDNGLLENVGHVTWCGAETGCFGNVLSNQSLIGDQAGAVIGSELKALSNGNFVVGSYSWKNGGATRAGAVTWCPGDRGCEGYLTPENSLVGTQTNDRVGNIIQPLENSNYIMIHNTFSNGTLTSSGAVTLGAGNAPKPVGPVSSENSILGMVANIQGSHANVYDAVNGQLIVGRSLENLVSFLSIPSTSITSGEWNDPNTWDFGVPALNGEAIISSGHTVTVSNSAAIRNVTIQNGGTLTLASDSSLNIKGDFKNQGSFYGLAGTVIFTGSGEHILNTNGPTTFGNLTVQPEAVLIEQPTDNFFTVQGNLDNQGVIRKVQPVSDEGRLRIGLTGVEVEITELGGLSELQVEQVDQNHPNAADSELRTGSYWSIHAVENGNTPYHVNLYLPHGMSEKHEKAKVCRFTGSDWSCGRSGSDSTKVWQEGLQQIEGDWTVRQEKDIAIIELTDLNQVYDGQAKPVQAMTIPADLLVDLLYTGVDGTIYEPSALPPVNAGHYSIVVTVVDENYSGSAQGSLIITKANAIVQLDDLNQVYDGSPRAVKINTTPPDLLVNVVYQGSEYGPSNKPPVEPGSYTVEATIDDANYQGTAKGTLIIGEIKLFLPLLMR